MTDENNKQNPPAPYGPAQYPPNYYAQPYPQDDEIDLRELFGIIWDGKWWIIAITFVFAVASVIYSLSLPNIYKAEATLAPTEESQVQGVNDQFSQFGQLGGLASLAGVKMGAQQVDKVTMAMEIMQSRQFLKNFIDRHNLVPEIMAVKKWDRNTGRLIFNKEVYNPETGEWLREVEPPKQPEPSSWEYVNAFRDGMLTVEMDQETPGLITVSVSHQSPILARKWTEWLVQDINDNMRQRDITEAQSSLEYLQEELEKTDLTSMQQVFYQLVEKQIQTIMMANIRPEYTFQTLDPAVAPEEKDAPSRALICIIATFLGGFLSLIGIFIRHFFRK